MAKPMWSFTPMGEAALLVEAREPDVAMANAHVATLARAIEGEQLAGLRLIQPAINSVLIRFDPLATTADAVRRHIERSSTRPSPTLNAQHRITEIPVSYGGDAGPDLVEAAQALGVTEAQLIAAHCAEPLRVLMIGFAPGFPYIGPLPSSLHLPRRNTPRSAVPAGSVAIAAGMTGIYPSALPGGWRLIGRTNVTLFDPQREPPSLLQAGDWVRFMPL
jgi:KipI family sensor histidine kinase inhibitor